MSILISFLSFILSTFAFLYANKRHKLNMLDHLDDKSEWRKKLLELAGKHPIETSDIHKLRAFVRFDKNDKSNKNDKYHIMDNEKLTPFQNITDAIIGYREYLYDKKILNNTKNDETEIKPELSEKHAEMIRIFARYLLANHWEVLQLTQAEKYRYNEKKHYSNAHYTKIESLYFKTVNLLFNERIDKKVTNWIEKEEQLYKYTFNEYKDVIRHPK
ncbi:hypothetical protein [Staphylococcus warneri]|uniref:hypothetical protein n=1 Tax=Staphylococcus warneri TaxID=1292 RepID=UPI002929E7B8|nr:hypothetical protein [Staphylococcus warneri]MDU9351545.1 hypothetical protein [Staphylococcus warneri]